MNNNEDYVVVEYTEESRKKMHKKSIKIMAILGITLVVLVVATYAWFVGITTVFVDEFDVQVETMKGLEISFSGASNDWHNGENDPARINKNNISQMGVSNNRWVDDKGLVPISTSGSFTNTGHLKFFSNGSMESITGGYNIRTELIDNETIDQGAGDTSPEKGQYITFDMFLKNTSNTLNVDDSTATVDKGEAVYLTVNSFANTSKHVPVEGGAEGDYTIEEDDTDTDGLENSLRVGFYQIAYAGLNETQSNLQNLSCSSTNTLCSGSANLEKQASYWNIWEPNDVDHEQKAIGKFANCKLRTSATAYSSTTCPALVNGSPTLNDNTTVVNTFGVNKVIAINDKVNIYDGLNGYTANSTGDNNFLREVVNLKDSENVIDTVNPYNTDRSQIIRLMPNKITKVRVYIWLEGQDPDNLDYTDAESKKLIISFGFTKDMYEEEPVDNRTTASSTETPTENTNP